MVTFNPLAVIKAADSPASAGSTSQTSTNGIQPQQITTQDFMTLLTTQLQNQDPTNPVDPTQFVTQLAQFTTLDQVSQINSLLQTIVQGDLAPSGAQGSSGTGSSPANTSGDAQGTTAS